MRRRAAAAPRAERTPQRLRGGYALAAFALLAVFTALSVTWSLMPNDSWLETNRTLAYFAVFAGGLALARLRPQSWTALLAGIAISAVALAAWSVLTKVFPAAFATDETYARLRPPFDYWNSVGLAAALGVPALLWLGVRRSGHAALNALAWPGLGLLVMSLMLAVSRGALLAVAIGTAIWLIAVPLRLRAAILIGGVLVATVPLVAWAFAQDGITGDNARMALRTDAGQGFGALLLLLLVTLSVAGLAVGFISAVKPPGPKARARATRVLVGALAVVPAVAVLMLANAPGGISGQVSKAWHQATDPAISGPTNSPERLTATSSGRARYWREAMKVHAQAPWLGTGAGSYGTLRLRYRVDARQVQHAHGYVVQTLSDLGWVGLAVSLLAAGAWLTGAARVVGIPRRDRGLPWDAERIGLATLATVAIVFGLHSAIDWTWFVPGNVLPALLAAGWVVSRTTLRERIGGLAEPRRAVQRQVLVGAAAVVTLLGFVAAWSAVQPIRSDHAQSRVARAARQGPDRRGGVDRADRPRPQPALDRPAVRPGRDRAGRGAQRAGQAGAEPGDRPRARQPGVVAPARALPDRPARLQGRAELLPDRLLPRPARPAEHDRHRDRLAAASRRDGPARLASAAAAPGGSTRPRSRRRRAWWRASGG